MTPTTWVFLLELISSPLPRNRSPSRWMGRPIVVPMAISSPLPRNSGPSRIPNTPPTNG